MLINSKGRAYTQRVEPKLALIEVEMPPEAFAEDWQPTPDDHMGIFGLPLISLIISVSLLLYKTTITGSVRQQYLLNCYS